MSETTAFEDWDESTTSLWGRQPVRIRHRLADPSLFSMDSLAAIIEKHPRQYYNIVEMGPQGSPRRFWREGDITGLSGHEVLDAISNGRLWLNIRQLNKVDSRFSHLLNDMFAEFRRRVPGFEALRLVCGILVSSPRAQVYYHADLPGQMLMQVAGRKRVYVYPQGEPFMSRASLEHIAVFGVEVDVPYEPWYDRFARTYELEPGQLVYWPLMAPHRVENHDCLNISMTIEFSSDAIRRVNRVILANGLLRQRLGWTPRSQTASGPSFWTKVAMAQMLRRWSSSKAREAASRKVEFQFERADSRAAVDVSN
jgi:hypothetical protein